MATAYEVVISVPATQVAAAFTKRITVSDQIVQQIQVSKKKEKRASQIATIDLHDPYFTLLSQLPDPAFFDVPVIVKLAPRDTPTHATVVVFDGKIKMLHGHTGNGLTTLQIVAEDKSLDMRRTSRCRTFRNQSSTQIASKIASDHGLSVDLTELGDVTAIQVAIDHGIAPSSRKDLSDWDHLQRVLAADGLKCVVRGTTVKVMQNTTAAYPGTISPDSGRVIDLSVSINHVRSPGHAGNNATPAAKVAWETSGTDKAMTSTPDKAEANAAKGGDSKGHRKPIGDGRKWSNRVTEFKGRKDELSITMLPEPALEVWHSVELTGYGGKVDGKWEVVEVSHVLVPGDGGSQTRISAKRGTSKGGAKQVAGGVIAFETNK